MPGVPGIQSYSNVAASNISLFPEGMAPSAVNDGMRQVQADIRAWYTDAEWVNWGDTPSRASNTTFKIAADVTSRYTAHRRLKCYDATTLYATVTASSYSAPDTTVTVVTDSGSLSSSLSSVALAALTPTSVSVPSTIGRKGADIASATTTDIGAATGDFVDVTGTTTITGLGTIGSGIVRTVRFTGALTLTHNATSLILPGAANITTANGDTAVFRSLGSGNWVCINYTKADGTPVVSSSAPADAQYLTLATNGTLTVERVLTAGSGLTGTDAGAGSTYTLALTNLPSLILLQKQTPSGVASINFSSTYITTTYKNYLLVGENVVPASDGVNLLIRLSADNGGAIAATGYKGNRAYCDSSSTFTGASATTSIPVGDNGIGNAAGEYVSFHTFLYGVSDSSAKTSGASNGTWMSTTTTLGKCEGSGCYDTARQDNYIQVLFSAGNIASGTFYLFGIKDS